MPWLNYEQGSQEWLDARRGVITGSRFKDARDKLKTGAPSKAAISYAMDLARERLGGQAPSKFQSAAMRTGQEQEPIARARYEMRTGNFVDEVGSFFTDDGVFGVSPDGLIGDDGVLEIKTVVSSETLFKTIVDGDYSEYIDQCNGYLLLLKRKWVDLVIWCPDVEVMKIVRIARDDAAIELLETDLGKFAEIVRQFESKLTLCL